jgi:hypothetical protein
MAKMLEDKEGNVSSKRVAGFILGGVGVGGLIAIGVVSIFRAIADPETALESFKTILIVGGALL